MTLQIFRRASEAHCNAWRGARVHRGGFTLLETLVALGLCGLIVAAIGSATHLYWKYRSYTKGQIQTSQLTRGLAEDFSSDLRSATPPQMMEMPSVPQDASVSQSPASAAGSAAALREAVEAFRRQISTVAAPIHFVGTPRAFALLTEHSNPRIAEADSEYRMATPQHIVWWVNDGSSQQLTLGVNAGSQQDVALTAPDDSVGLIRSARNFEIHDLTRRIPFRSQLITEEVTALKVRYFDGQRWRSDWNSHQQQNLPSLVEIEVWFDRTAGAGAGEKIVIALPQGRKH